MEKHTDSLFGEVLVTISQFITIIIIILIFIFIVKFYRRYMFYLRKKIELIEKKLNKDN
ncbi:heme/copper-type cytochrome/quinol oxidase subunit 2 [Mesonia maritima]|uniref:Heme/copper-type cytochrome/quinol oxidase subunit 2 n=1 Tax=Mesonia maritima TaxID=1793873 RepID=A0ABU1K4R7_9FLAO|nr:heme/copper-type cytochrome/quinol oxidase subunit 2 [Mesonia maritima]